MKANKPIPNDIVATFSIVGFDPKTEELGIAVQSKFLGVGAVVPWAKAGIGAVATQSHANTAYGPKGLHLMSSGKSAQETLKLLTEEDDERDLRQVGIVDKEGNAATFTGEGCYDWAGGRVGHYNSAQGNILVGPETVEAMGKTFEGTEGSLAERLLAAIDAGQEAGGDRRGRQSAALLVVKEKGGYGGYNDRALDLRVDDHPEPIRELERIYQLHQLYFAGSKSENIVAIDDGLRSELTQELKRLGYLGPSEAPYSNVAFDDALTSFIHTENFEEREQVKGKIDLEVVDFMKSLRR
ncbi:MAG TPA: DUF1028 domain-containing protein [Bacillales bacterium]|nr:DUF1028 domain-containing protein [Bacillales bacterium]